MVSMKDIAARVGVSKTTVSLVLNGKAGSKVSEEVKNKVIRAVKDMNYQVNSLARSLRTGETKVISVIVADISNEFFGQLTFSIQEEAKKAGYLVMTINSNESAREFDDAVSAMMGKKVDGFIVVPTPGSEPAIERILGQNVPVVTVDRLCEGLSVDYVGVDNYRSAREAVAMLVEEGCRSISMLGLDLDIPPLNDRQRAYEEIMDERGLKRFKDVRRVSFGLEEDETISRAFSGLEDKDAIFFTSRRAFTHAMTRAARNGERIPRKQRLLCFDDISPYKSISGNICYVEQPVEEMARKAFELLINQIRGNRAMGRYLYKTNFIGR